MQPISPVLTEEFIPNEVVYAKDQPQYLPLPSIRSTTGIVLTRWKPTEDERVALANGADIYLSVHTYNHPLQPILLEVICCDRDMVEVAQRMELLVDKSTQ